MLETLELPSWSIKKSYRIASNPLKLKVYVIFAVSNDVNLLQGDVSCL